MTLRVLLSTAFLTLCTALAPGQSPTLPAPADALTAEDLSFLDDLEKTAWRFFDEQTNAQSGLTPDRAKADGSSRNRIASIAASGFALPALCIADSRGWISHPEALHRARTTLHSLLEKAPQEHGFFYHFLDTETAARAWNSEVSSIDTALLLAGVVTAREYFDDPELRELAGALADRIDWPWMLHDGPTLTLGWTPEKGFLPYRWQRYSEHMVMELLGIGAAAHPLPPATWKAWKRAPIFDDHGTRFIACPPLFTYQYSHAFVDFRGRTDAFADYFVNSRLATLAQRRMCIALHDQFPLWGPLMWGVTASVSDHGYVAWGGPPATTGSRKLDGTLVPCAPGGSIPFAPRECLDTLRNMRTLYGGTIWGRYGFADAFNPHNGWVSPDVLAIDVGITLLMAENERTGLIWHSFMKAPEIQRALPLAGFGPAQELQPDSSLVKDSPAEPAP